MKSLLNILIAVLVCALLYILIYPQYQESKVYTLKVGTDRSVNPLILFFAEERAILKGQKLTPEYIFSDSPDSLFEKLLTDEIDIAILPWSYLLKRVIEKGETVKVFISQNFRLGIPVDAILTNPKSKIGAFQDLKGKRLGYPPIFRDLLPFILNSNGLSPKDLILQELPAEEISRKLLSQELDAAFLFEPYRTKLLRSGQSLLLDAVLPKTFLTPYPAFAYALNPKFLRTKRKVGVRLKIATDMAISLIDKEPHNVRELLIQKLALDPDRTRDFNLPEIEKLAGINKAGLISYLAHLADGGLVEREKVKDFKPENILVPPLELQP